MKAYIIAIVIAVLSTVITLGSQPEDTVGRLFGLSVYHSSTGSGYGSNLSLSIGIEKERRMLEAGMLFQPNSSTISGGEVLYKRFLSPVFSNGSEGNQIRPVRFFIQYNFIFRHKNLPDYMAALGGDAGEQMIPGGRVATYEHYMGLGMQVRVADNINLNTAVGFGTYLGSVNEEDRDPVHYTDGGRRNYVGPTIKLGLGYSFLNR